MQRASGVGGLGTDADVRAFLACNQYTISVQQALRPRANTPEPTSKSKKPGTLSPRLDPRLSTWVFGYSGLLPKLQA